jgi:hypothetical protein
MSPKTLFKYLGLNCTQQSNTPVLQYSGKMLSTKPIICNLASKTMH